MGNKRKFGLMIAMFALVLTVSLFGSHKKAYALVTGGATNSLVNQVVSHVNDICDLDPTNAVCNGQYHSPFSYAYLYVPVAGLNVYPVASVTINGLSSNSIDDFQLRPLMKGSPDNCGPVGDEWPNAVRPTRPFNGATLQMPTGTPGIESITDANYTFVVYCVGVYTGSAQNVSYSLNSSQFDLLGVFSGAPSVSGIPTGTGYFGGNSRPYTAPPGVTNWWNEDVAFSAPCDPKAGSGGPMVLYDLDTYQNPSKNMHIRVVKRPKLPEPIGDSPPGVNIQLQSPDGSLASDLGGFNYLISNKGSGSSYIITTSETYDPAYVYTVYLENIGSANKIRIKLPFDQIDSVLACKNTPDPTCANLQVFDIDNGDSTAQIFAGDHIGFRVTVANANGYQIGVNDNGWGDEYPDPRTGGPTTNIDNYLVQPTANKTYFRGGPAIAGDGTQTVEYRTIIVAPADGPEVAYNMVAPPAGGSTIFNWGFVVPTVGWANVTCTGSVTSVAKVPAITCPVLNMSAEPGDTLPVIVSFGNTGNTPLTGASLGVVIGAQGSQAATFTPDPLPAGAGSTATSNSPITANIPNSAGDVAITWTISGGNLPSPKSCTGNISVAGKPYFRTYGGDVRACSGTTDTWGKVSGTGAGAEYGLISAGSASGFSSASQRVSFPTVDRDLTFANNPGLGGFGASTCAPNYWTSLLDAPTGVGSPVSLAASGQVIVNGSATIPAQSTNSRLTVFVKGNVYITGAGISYGPGAWPTVASIPYLTVVACGDIYIDKGVTQLTGWYIAVPPAGCGSGVGTGTIYTCTNGNALETSTTQYADCLNPLTVRGSFSAQNIKFGRTRGTLNRGVVHEGSGSANIAETFIYGAESWVGRPVQKPKPPTTGGTKFESITGLPPIL